jgi:hypothetical protein
VKHEIIAVLLITGRAAISLIIHYPLDRRSLATEGTQELSIINCHLLMTEIHIWLLPTLTAGAGLDFSG